MTTDSLAEQIRELSGVLRQLSATVKALSAFSGVGTNLLYSLVPNGQVLSMATGAMNLLELFRNAGPELHFHQEIVINIGEGQVSEKAFWDNLVQYHILPGLERGGFIPVRVGGRG
ncbi:MAG: hypothetical protein ABIN58_12970 [candidate division WOR-3 bacterium]